MKANELFTKANGYSWVGSSFKDTFGEMDVAPSFGEGLTSKKLPRSMNHTDILKELGPNEVSLGDVHAYLKTADKKWYLFYVRNESGALWAVVADWDDDGWGVGADAVSFPVVWRTDDHVVSREFFSPSEKTLSPSDTLPSELTINGVQYRKITE